ncbi:MAG TPA: protealysin inhibitor emfourin [Holophagaceae bacterium]|nr:protealysin inhibitor emfourin [Holophagaceae bacterium]
MIISLFRRGGFAGLEQALGSVDLDGLPGETVRSAEARLARLEQALRDTPAGAGADRFRIDVELRTPAGIRTLSVIDEGDPQSPPMQALAELAKDLGLGLS